MAVELTQDNMLRSRNPANMQVLGEVAVSSRDEILAAVGRAREAQAAWKLLSISRRLHYIERFRRVLLARGDELAELITRETGKPLLESYGGELFGPLETCRWLERNAGGVLRRQPVRLNRIFFHGKKSYNVFEPLGTIAVVSPWNYAFSIPVCTMLSALAAGNAVVLKPSPKTPLVSKAIERLFVEAGFPAGLVGLVVGDQEEARTLINSDVDKVIFTGSVGGGKAIMALAAAKLLPVTLELGGKHAAIVLEDADVDKVAAAIVWGAFTNAGQACASIERLYAVKPVARRLAGKIAELTRKLRLGDGLAAGTDVGPLIDEEQLRRVESMVAEAVACRARLIAGGKARRDLGGYFFEPTVLVNVSPGMRIAREEIFGPVLPIIVVADEDEAVRLANDSNLGLGASVWSGDPARAERLARTIQAGMVWVNDGLYSHSCPDAPWGGVKESGFGRMHGAVSLKDLVYVKHVGVDRQGARDWHYPYSAERLDLVRSGIAFCHAPTLAGRLRAAVRAVKAWLRLRLR